MAQAKTQETVLKKKKKTEAKMGYRSCFSGKAPA
jgi:hypothetical protein